MQKKKKIAMKRFFKSPEWYFSFGPSPTANACFKIRKKVKKEKSLIIFISRNMSYKNDC